MTGLPRPSRRAERGLRIAGALLAAGAVPVAGQTIAITGATIYPVSAPRIENGILLMRDGRIAAVGREVTIPAGAIRIDASGRWITPGLIHSATRLGLAEVDLESVTVEDTMSGDVSAAFNVAEALNPASVRIPIARIEGVTAALAQPSGGLIAGQAVVISLRGEHAEDMLLQSPAAMMVTLGSSSKPAGGGSRAGTLARLRQIFRDALEYDRRKADFKRDQIQPLAAPAPDLEALLPVLKGELPAYVVADRRSDIDNALRLAAEFKLKLIIQSGQEAWKSAAALAAAGVPVAVDPYANIPSFDGLGARYDNAALLRKAGVPLLIYETQTGGPRGLRFAAGQAVRSGLAWEEALRAITLAPAQAFGVADRLGSLDTGKSADLVVWSGDPFEFSTQPERVFIRGIEVPRVSRQTELFSRYRTLPPGP